MDAISQSDHLRILDFVRDCYAIRGFDSFEEFQGRLVKSLSSLIPSLHATYNEISLTTATAYNIGSTRESSSPEVSRLLAQHMMDHSPLCNYLQTGDAQAVRISDLEGQRQFYNTGLYTEFYRHYDVKDDLCIGLSHEPTRLVTIAWHSDRRFTDCERNMANLIHPHVIQAWQNALIFGEMHRQLSVLNDGLAGAALGVIACNAEGEVQHTSALARQYLTEYFGATKNLDRQLPEKLLSWVRSQSAQLKGYDLPAVRLPFVAQKEGNRLSVRLQISAGAILLLLEERTLAVKATVLEGASLSPRESEVLGWAAQGKTNGEIAAILGMSLATAKKHMEHILRKLGVETRTAAAALALQLPNYD